MQSYTPEEIKQITKSESKKEGQALPKHVLSVKSTMGSSRKEQKSAEMASVPNPLRTSILGFFLSSILKASEEGSGNLGKDIGGAFRSLAINVIEDKTGKIDTNQAIDPKKPPFLTRTLLPAEKIIVGTQGNLQVLAFTEEAYFNLGIVLACLLPIVLGTFSTILYKLISKRFKKNRENQFKELISAANKSSEQSNPPFYTTQRIRGFERIP